MVDRSTVDSFLAADIGTTLTHVCLVDRVENRYRLIASAEAPTVYQGSEIDLCAGLLQAIAKLENIAQRQLTRDGSPIIPEHDSGMGIDCFLATTNAASPVRCAIIGPDRDPALESATHVCAISNAHVETVIHIPQTRRLHLPQTLTALSQISVDVIILTGGRDGESIAPLENIAHLLLLVFKDTARSQRPTIIYSGNQEARRPIRAILEKAFELSVIDNIRPDTYTESFQELIRELIKFYRNQKLAQLTGFDRLATWSEYPILPTFEATEQVLNFVAHRDNLERGLLGADIGGSHIHLAAVHKDTPQATVYSDAGTAHTIRDLVQNTGTIALRRWLPMAMSGERLLSHLENIALHPTSIPQTEEDLYLMHAMACESIRTAMQDMHQTYWFRSELTPELDLVMSRGSLIAHTPKDSLSVFTLLNALEPTGIVRLAIDYASIWPQIGSIAQASPLAATQTLNRDGWRMLGTAICPIGTAQFGSSCLELTLTRKGQGTQSYSIPAGTLQRIPLPAGERATLQVRTHRPFHLNLEDQVVVEGGSLGLVIDTRGRPLPLPDGSVAYRSRIQSWLESL